MFRSVLDAISKNSKIVEINFEDFYSIFKNFLEQEYYKTFENESIALKMNLVQERVAALGGSQEEFIKL